MTLEACEIFNDAGNTIAVSTTPEQRGSKERGGAVHKREAISGAGRTLAESCARQVVPNLSQAATPSLRTGR